MPAPRANDSAPPISPRIRPRASSICSRCRRPSATRSMCSAASGAWSKGCTPKSTSAHANEQAAYLALTANIVNTVVAAAAYRAEIEATQQLIELQKEQVQIANVQAQAGTVPYSNVLSLRSQLASYEATIPQLEQKLAQSDDLLAALAGHTPAEWSAPQCVWTISRCRATCRSACRPIWCASVPTSWRPKRRRMRPAPTSVSRRPRCCPSITLNGSPRGRDEFNQQPVPLQRQGVERRGRRHGAAVRRGNLVVQAQSGDRGLPAGDGPLPADRARAHSSRSPTRCARSITMPQSSWRTTRRCPTAAEALHLVQANYEAGIATYLDRADRGHAISQAKIADLQAIAVRYQDTVALFAALGGGWWSTPSAAAGAAAPKVN